MDPEQRAGSYDWSYAPAVDLDKTLLERLKSFPRQPDLAVYTFRSAAMLAARAFLRAYHRLSIRQVAPFPADRSLVLVANHTSHLDALALISLFPLTRLHRVFPAAAEDYFFRSVPRIAFSSIVVNALPFRRKAGVRESLALCRCLLETPGNVLIIFPEGTRSPDGRLRSFKPGIGHLVAGTPIPVFPCRITGAHRAWPKGRVLPLPRKVSISAGEPCEFSALGTDRASVEAVALELHRRVAALEGGER